MHERSVVSVNGRSGNQTVATIFYTARRSSKRGPLRVSVAWSGRACSRRCGESTGCRGRATTTIEATNVVVWSFDPAVGVLILLWWYATHRRRYVHRNASSDTIHAIFRRLATTIGVMTVAIPIAFASTTVAFSFMVFYAVAAIGTVIVETRGDAPL